LTTTRTEKGKREWKYCNIVSRTLVPHVEASYFTFYVPD